MDLPLRPMLQDDEAYSERDAGGQNRITERSRQGGVDRSLGGEEYAADKDSEERQQDRDVHRHSGGKNDRLCFAASDTSDGNERSGWFSKRAVTNEYRECDFAPRI
jgi:hypothetical protein